MLCGLSEQSTSSRRKRGEQGKAREGMARQGKGRQRQVEAQHGPHRTAHEGGARCACTNHAKNDAALARSLPSSRRNCAVSTPLSFFSSPLLSLRLCYTVVICIIELAYEGVQCGRPHAAQPSMRSLHINREQRAACAFVNQHIASHPLVYLFAACLSYTGSD